MCKGRKSAKIASLTIGQDSVQSDLRGEREPLEQEGQWLRKKP